MEDGNKFKLLLFSLILSTLPGYSYAGLGDVNITVRDEIGNLLADANVLGACAGGDYALLGLTNASGVVNADINEADANCDPSTVNTEDFNIMVRKNGYSTLFDVNNAADWNSLKTSNLFDANGVKFGHKVTSNVNTVTVTAGVNNTACDQNGTRADFYCPVVLADDNGTNAVIKVNQGCYNEAVKDLNDRTVDANAQFAYSVDRNTYVPSFQCGVITDPSLINDANTVLAGKLFVYNILITLASVVSIIILTGLVVFVLRALGITLAF